MIPATAALLGMAIAEVRSAALWLAACALLLIAFPIAAPLVPVAVATGLTHAPAPQFQWIWLAPIAIAALVWKLDRRGNRIAAVLTIVAGATVGTVYLKTTAAADLDRIASARSVWRELAPRQDSICIDWVPRGMEYSLDYYFVPPLPKCVQHPRPVWLRQLAGQLPSTGPPKRRP